MATPVDNLLDQIRAHFNKAQDAINSLVRVQVAQGLAATFLERSRPFQDDGRLAALVRDGLLNEAAFMQKAPALLRFYTRLFAGLKAERILEIGVKGGGSTAFWKQLFPSATVVGLDIDIRPRWVATGSFTSRAINRMRHSSQRSPLNTARSISLSMTGHI